MTLCEEDGEDDDGDDDDGDEDGDIVMMTHVLDTKSEGHAVIFPDWADFA